MVIVFTARDPIIIIEAFTFVPSTVVWRSITIVPFTVVLRSTAHATIVDVILIRKRAAIVAFVVSTVAPRAAFVASTAVAVVRFGMFSAHLDHGRVLFIQFIGSVDDVYLLRFVTCCCIIPDDETNVVKIYRN